MNRNALWPLAALLLALAALFAAGCSDDDNPTGNTGGTNADSTSFTRVNQQVETFDFESVGNSIDITGAALEQTWPSVFNAPGKRMADGKALAADSIVLGGTFDYTHDGDWHIFTMQVTIVDTEKGAEFGYSVVDSVRFRLDQTIVADPTTDFNTVDDRKHFDWWRNPDSLMYGTGMHVLEVALDQNPADSSLIVTINGQCNENTHAEWVDDGADCETDVVAQQTITDLEFMDSGPGDGDCPSAGSASATASVHLLCTKMNDTLEVNNNWEVTTTILENGDIQVFFDNGTVTWTVTTDCAGAQSGGKNEGDGEDPAFQEVLGFVEGHEYWDLLLMNVMYSTADSVLNTPPAAGKWKDYAGTYSLGADETTVVSIEYHEVSGYWVTSLVDTSYDTTESTVDVITVTDSIKLFEGETPMQYPTPANVTKILKSGSITFAQPGSGMATIMHNYVITGHPFVEDDTMYVDGHSQLSYGTDGVDGDGCTVDITANAVKDNIGYPVPLSLFECLQDGQIDWTADVNLYCSNETDTLQVNDLWAVQITFAAPYLYITAENSTSRWVVNESCGVVTAPRRLAFLTGQ